MVIHPLNTLEKDIKRKINEIIENNLRENKEQKKSLTYKFAEKTLNSDIFFILRNSTPTFVVKKVNNINQYNKELKAYKEYLRGFMKNIPKLIGSFDNILIFEYVGETFIKYSKNNNQTYFILVLDWLKYKFNFCKKSKHKYLFNYEEQFLWLVEERVKNCQNFYSLDIDINYLRNFNSFVESKIPNIYVLEHGDLESKNIIYNDKDNEIKIIDFGASFRSNGLNDLAMIWLTFYKLQGIDYKDLIIDSFSHLYGCSPKLDYWKDKKVFKDEIKMNINLIKNFYYEKNFNYGC
jgi:serine/threonine protein kinase